MAGTTKTTEKAMDMKDAINPDTGLSARQEEFCRQYLIGAKGVKFNGTQAALAAGYAKSGAAVQATRLLKNDKVQEFLGKLQAPTIKQFEITQERIMQEWASLAFSNIMDFVTVNEDTGQAYVDLSKMTREQAAALEGFEITELPPQELVEGGQEYEREVLKTKIKLRDKWGPLEALAKREGLVKEVIKIETDDLLQGDINEVARRVAFMLRMSVEDQKKAATESASQPPA